MIAWLVALAVAVMTSDSLEERQLEKELIESVASFDRYVDIGVTLVVVAADPNGFELQAKGPRVREVARRSFGGVVDTAASFVCDRSQRPITWHCSEDQYPLILHADAAPRGQLVVGSEGAGKTTALAMWHYLRWLENLGERREGGQTAPTLGRLGLVRHEIDKLWPSAWRRYVARDEFEGYELCDGSRIRFRHTHRQSQAAGSPIQGFNWSWCGRDETQDQVDVHEDIENRGRAAKHGGTYYKQFGTATAKDASDWRELRDKLRLAIDETSKRPLWTVSQLLGRGSPFVSAEFWDAKKQTMSPREYARRIECRDDLPLELAVYYGWNRERNLVELPQIVTDVTGALLAGYRSYIQPGRSFGLLCAHDPGSIFNTTTVKRLFMFGSVPTWAVVGELQTSQTTQRQHAQALVTYLRDEFYVNHPTIGGPLAMTFVDPHGKGEAQTDYDSVYGAFQKERLDVFSPSTGKIKRRARIEMMNRLLGGSAASPAPRLVVCRDKRGKVLAPKLVEAFETMRKQPGNDDPEGVQKKDEDDKTHAPAACAYGLWMFEQEALTEQTQRIAIAAAGGRR